MALSFKAKHYNYLANKRRNLITNVMTFTLPARASSVRPESHVFCDQRLMDLMVFTAETSNITVSRTNIVYFKAQHETVNEKLAGSHVVFLHLSHVEGDRRA